MSPHPQAETRRDLAKRARRMAQNRTATDKERLLQYAEELEEQAARLEADATEPAPLPLAPIPQQQVQQQQQGPVSKAATPKP